MLIDEAVSAGGRDNITVLVIDAVSVASRPGTLMATDTDIGPGHTSTRSRSRRGSLMQTIYRPGQWYLIVIPGALVALPPDVPGDVVARLWERLPEDKTLATVVDVLTTHAGGSFTSLPSFVAAVAEGADVRIALRGAVLRRRWRPGRSRSSSRAPRVTTWNERFLGGATKIDITVEAPADAVGSARCRAASCGPRR